MPHTFRLRFSPYTVRNECYCTVKYKVPVTENYGNDMTEKAVRICRAYLPGAWKKITAGDVEVNRISGGLSNWLYHVKLAKHVNHLSDNNPREVLLRLYGQSHGECGAHHIITESVIFALLSERKLGPRLHGVFAGGRIEEYVPARPLRLAELRQPKLSMLIAEKMAAIHSLNLPLSRDPTWLWDTMIRWYNDIGDVNTLEFKNLRLKNLLKTDLSGELKWLRMYLSQLHSPVVFCHNDMQEGNILVKNNALPSNTVDVPADRFDRLNASSLIIIDYEYCAYNYRSYEIANHFIEWIFDYTVPDYPYFSVLPDQYPTKEQQTAFVQHYLSTINSSESATSVLEEVKYFTLASHLLWVLWSLSNGKSSKITFGYWDYAAERLQMYYSLKSQLLSNTTGSILTPRSLRPC